MSIALACALLISGLARAQEDTFEQAQQLIREKKTVEALAVLERARREYPGDARPYFYTGVALLEAGQLRQAAVELERAVELDPSRPEFSLIFAETLSRLDLSAAAGQALEVFEREGRLEELSARELWLLVDLELRLDRFGQALKALDRIEQLRPDVPEIRLRRAEIHLNRRDYESAARDYGVALQHPRLEGEASYGLGVVRWKMGQFEDARLLLLQALEKQPSNPEIYYHLGLVALELDRPEEAIPYLESLAPGGDDYPEIYHALGKAYRRAGNEVKSREYFEKFERAESRRESVQTGRRQAGSLVKQALDSLQTGAVSQAQALFQRALEADPNQWTAHKFLAQIYMSQDVYTLAHSHLEAMERLRPEDVDVQALRAGYWYGLADPLRARPYAEKAKALRPGDAELRNLAGNIYVALGMQAEARTEYQAAVELAPERQDFRLNLESVARSETPEWP